MIPESRDLGSEFRKPWVQGSEFRKPLDKNPEFRKLFTQSSEFRNSYNQNSEFRDPHEQIWELLHAMRRHPCVTCAFFQSKCVPSIALYVRLNRMYVAFNQGREFPESDVADLKFLLRGQLIPEFPIFGNRFRNFRYWETRYRNFRHWEIPSSEIPALISHIPDF